MTLDEARAIVAALPDIGAVLLEVLFCVFGDNDDDHEATPYIDPDRPPARADFADLVAYLKETCFAELPPRTRTVEYFRCWPDRTWDTDFIDIPADTPPDEVAAAIMFACSTLDWKDDIAPDFVGLYRATEEGERDEDDDAGPIESGDPPRRRRRRPVPSLRYDFVINAIGYQVDIYADGRRAGSACRDFGGGYEDEAKMAALQNDLNARICDAVEAWRRAH